MTSAGARRRSSGASAADGHLLDQAEGVVEAEGPGRGERGVPARRARDHCHDLVVVGDALRIEQAAQQDERPRVGRAAGGRRGRTGGAVEVGQRLEAGAPRAARRRAGPRGGRPEASRARPVRTSRDRGRRRRRASRARLPGRPPGGRHGGRNDLVDADQHRAGGRTQRHERVTARTDASRPPMRRSARSATIASATPPPVRAALVDDEHAPISAACAADGLDAGAGSASAGR